MLTLAASRGSAQEIRFDAVANATAGLDFERGASSIRSIALDLRAAGPLPIPDLLLAHPIKSNGAPGVALLDYDRDGDFDLYVTDGPGRANALYENRSRPGAFAFVRQPRALGADATTQDSTGVCAGDLDNDGDTDLVVLGRGDGNRVFENRVREGRGFVDATARSGSDLGRSRANASSCALGDLDGDGRLDLFVGNTFDWSDKVALLAEPFALNEPNQLFLNRGNFRFRDVSQTAGIRGPVNDISWSIAIFDYDGDGDLDVLVANDQGGIPLARYGGIDRGFVRILENDGRARFTDVTAEAGMLIPGGWMGFAIADYDGNGTIDLWVSSVGDWIEKFVGLPYMTGDQSTRAFLNNGDGTFRDPGVGALVATPWAWGTAALDADNDGDFDVASVGGLDAGPFIERSNPGAIFANGGAADFRFALDLGLSRRNDHALAVGDLDGDGREDLIAVSGENAPAALPSVPYPFMNGGDFDALATLVPTWAFQTDGTATWNGVEVEPGNLALLANASTSGHGFVEVEAIGGVGLASGARVPRSAFGTVVRATPEGGATASQPILGGSSHSSQDSPLAHFGLGSAASATIEVVWPGGVRNRLHDVESGERVKMPEIPCDFTVPQSFGRYQSCVRGALRDYERAGLLTRTESNRLYESALRAFFAGC